MIFAEYLQTRFVSDRTSWPSDFHILTAFNPEGVILSEKENLLRNDDLFRELDSLGELVFPITGGSPDGVHRESSFAVQGLTREQALSIGVRFGQNAIFEISSRILAVVGCRSGERREIGPFDQRMGFN